jgi:hypothetical protein
MRRPRAQKQSNADETPQSLAGFIYHRNRST